MNTIIKIENLSKQYRLGEYGTGTITHDLNRWWHKLRGKEDPYLKFGEVNDRATKSNSEYTWALRDVNFEVQQGEVLGIIGKNGAGKSTLLKLLSRVTSPTTGSIKAKGRIASLLEVGTGFHEELTGRENIFLNGAILGMTKAEIRSKLDEIIAFSGTERYIDTPVKRYSSGMRVRLAFAVAAHLEPDILIVDEVLAVGDAEFQKKAIGKMQDVAQGGGRTVLFVSHNMAAVQSLCNKGLLLSNGQVSYKGSISNVIESYLLNNTLVADTKVEFSLNRTGNGKVAFADFYMEDINGQRVETILSGSSVTLNFVLRVVESSEKVDVGFSINSKFGDNLSVLYSSYQNVSYSLTDQEYKIIKCKIDALPFAPGAYDVYGRVLVDGEEADWLKDPLGKMSVEMGDFYMSGKTGFEGNAPCLIKGNWTAS
ncbi:ABC transporter ATP-binding protein [Pontibacter diazotrophicus]|uniref:ABC transporter ATP-binding protein n=1 Tax=Pontibacter diazotrophicus TaxID=1400979 RepID=A0A3D8LC67_9BACT|nr:ABC transporter ATP-binding protein [Pontibacter diazotrophicus]